MRGDRILLAVSLCALAALFLGCAGIRNGPTSTPGGVISSTDGKCQVRVPEGWAARQDLNEQAHLQASCERADAYLLVISEPKIDFADHLTYRDYAELTIRTFRNKAQNVRIVHGPKDVIINGLPGVQYEIHATVNDVQLVYLRTVIDGTDVFHQLSAWTIRSKAPGNLGVLHEVTNSFRETK
jgi:hypothetical protein